MHVCISQLSAHLIREKNRVPRPSESFIPSFEEDTIGSRVRKALGDKLIEQLDGVHTKSNGPVNRIIRDGIEAWSTYCMYSATEPMLFGEMSRNCKEIADIYACMHDKGLYTSCSLGAAINHKTEKIPSCGHAGS